MPPSADSFLTSYPPAITKLAYEVRALIFEAYPRANERLNVGWRTISYGVGPGMGDQICYLAPQRESLTLGFMRGTTLPDPDLLLKGVGKHLRYMKFSPYTPLPYTTLLALLQSAFPVSKQ